MNADSITAPAPIGILSRILKVYGEKGNIHFLELKNGVVQEVIRPNLPVPALNSTVFVSQPRPSSCPCNLFFFSFQMNI